MTLAVTESMLDHPRKTRRGARSTPLMLGLAALLLIAALVAAASIDWRRLIVKWFGPPAVTMTEAYQPKPDGPTMDHAAFTTLLKKHVKPGGWVDYDALAKDRDKLQAYIKRIGEAPFDAMGRNEKLALLINAYNAFTLDLILQHWPVDSIMDIPEAKRWQAERWNVGGHTWSLNQIEHEQIRPNFKEVRIHWALVCAAYSCPPLRREAYAADKLDQQLADQTDFVHSHPRWVRYDADADLVHLTELYSWYGGDFEQLHGSVLKYVAQHVPAVRRDLEADDPPTVKWIDYSWKINDVSERPGG
jgi:hypothetical protein